MEETSGGGDVSSSMRSSNDTQPSIPTTDPTAEQPEVDISSTDAARFLTRLISLGYLHTTTAADGSSNNDNSSVNDAEPLLPLQEPQELTLESTKLAKSKLAQRRNGAHHKFTADDSNCCIVLKKKTCSGQGGAAAAAAGRAAATDNIDGCITRTDLVNQIELSIDSPRFGGRASISSLATHLAVDEAAIESSVATFAAVAPSLAEYVRVGNDVVSSHHFDSLANKVDAMISAASEGHIAVTELAMNVYYMPFDVCLASLVERLSTLKCNARIGNLHFGSGVSTRREIVSAAYDNDRAEELQARLGEAREPTHLIDLVQELQWDDEFAHDRVTAMIADGILNGELKADGDAYVPRVYAEVQRQGVVEFFSSNGYVNAELMVSLGLPASIMGKYVRESFPDAVELSDFVINVQSLIDPLEGLIQEAITLRSYLDMRAALPEALVSSEGDMQQILEDVLPPRLAEHIDFSDGVCILCDGEALYCSRGMIQDIETKVVLPLIESYGKKRAQEIDNALNSSSKKRQSSSGTDANDDGKIIRTGAKMKKSGKRGGGGKKSKPHQKHVDGLRDGDETAADKNPSGKEKLRGVQKGRSSSSAGCATVASDDSPGVISLVQIAMRVAEEYPDLANVQENCCPLIVDEDGDCPSWEPEDGYDGAGPLYEFCRRALCTLQFRRKCDQAVKAELDKIRSTRHGISIGASKAGAATAASINDAFEACFADACYLVQMLAKLPRSLSTGDVANEKKTALERDFLLGCAADFTCRITQYCLFKHEVDEGVFLVECEPVSSSSPVQELTTNSLPSFCQPVAMTTRSFGRIFLSCAPDEDGKDRDPLPTLRELLPGSIGIELARMWTSCGGECYQGGKKLGSEDGTEYVRPGNFEHFLRLVEESCLTICGLPFKKLDKKAEKNAIFTRRRVLTSELESSTNAREVLELTIMLLFQQTKGFVVAGDELIDTALEILCKEKKISEQVENELLRMRQHVKLAGEDEDIPDDLIASIRICGLSRDISKHDL